MAPATAGSKLATGIALDLLQYVLSAIHQDFPLTPNTFTAAAALGHRLCRMESRLGRRASGRTGAKDATGAILARNPCTTHYGTRVAFADLGRLRRLDV